MAFIVVHFLTNDNVAVASRLWLSPDKTECVWPPYEKQKLKRAILEHKKPEVTWHSYEVVVLGSYPNYITAEMRCKKALDTSTLDAEEDEREPKRRKSFHDDEWSGSSDESFSKKTKRKKSSNNVSSHSRKNKSGSSNWETDPCKSEPIDISPDSNECEMQILLRIEEMLKIQREQRTLLEQLLGTNPAYLSVPELHSAYIPKLPADNDLELDEWEAYLEDSPSFMSAIHMFSPMVGKDVGQSTRRLLSKILTNKLASTFNWVGSPPKKRFKDLKSVALIFCTLKESARLKDVTVDSVEKFIKHWLKESPARYNYHQKVKKDKSKTTAICE